MIDKYLFLIRSANREFEEPLETLGVVSLLEVVVVGGGGSDDTNHISCEHFGITGVGMGHL